MSKKIFLALLLTAALLTACGKSPSPDTSQPEENAVQQTSPDKDVVLDLGRNILITPKIP